MPEDTSPHGGEAFHVPSARVRIPDPPQGPEALTPDRSDTVPDPDAQAIAQRPTLPAQPRKLAFDTEDEDADPVGPGDAGAGREDPGDRGVGSVTRQPGG